jgi:hypothetical protein
VPLDTCLLMGDPGGSFWLSSWFLCYTISSEHERSPHN